MQNMRRATERELISAIAVIPFISGNIIFSEDLLAILPAAKDSLHLKVQKEILLAVEKNKISLPARFSEKKLRLPSEVVAKMGLIEGEWIAIIPRKNALALKAVSKDQLTATIDDKKVFHKNRPVILKALRPVKAVPFKGTKITGSDTLITRAKELMHRIPQVITIKQVTKNNVIRFNKIEAGTLDLKELKKIFFTNDHEILLTKINIKQSTDIPIEIFQNFIKLSPDIYPFLDLKIGDSIAFISHPDGIALKKVILELDREKKEYPVITDQETSNRLIRKITPQRHPERAIKLLRSRYPVKELISRLLKGVKRNQSLLGWVIRNLTECPEPGDKDLRKKLIEDRYNAQDSMGSFGNLMNSTRKLRELADLHADPYDPPVNKALEWILARPVSPYIPGLFFINDDEAEIHKKIIESKIRGDVPLRKYFRRRKSGFEKQITDADGITCKACGPQILWPTSYALEVLLLFGMENHTRVQEIYSTFLHYGLFCECDAQNGILKLDIKPDEYFSEQIDEAKARYYYGSAKDINDLLYWTINDSSRGWHPRAKDISTGFSKKYEITPTDLGCAGCSANIVRGLSHTSSPSIKLLAENILYRAALLQKPEGDFYDIGKEHFGSFHFLSVFSEWQHPVAHTVILRAIPWLKDTQNSDGTFGKGDKVEQTTIMVIKALINSLVSQNSLWMDTI